MRSPAASAALLILGLSLLTGRVPAAQAQAEQGSRSFRDWQVVCSQDASCSASTDALASAAGADQHRLRIAPSGAGPGHEVALLVGGRAPAGDTDLMLQIDDEAPFHPAPEGTYAATPAGLFIAEAETVRRLLRQMRAGGRITVGFTDATGEARRASFSLWGISAALDFMASRSRRLPPAATAAGDWSLQVADFLPAMRRCLVETPGGPAAVGKAWPMNRGMVGVRTLGADGRRWDCIAERIGEDVAMFDPVPVGAEALPGEAAPLFTPSGQLPPERSCYRHKRARDAGGSFVGWLSYPRC
jgi:invasion protein IalB